MRARDDGRVLDGGALHAVAGQRVGVLDMFGDVPRRQLAYKVCVGLDHDPLPWTWRTVPRVPLSMSRSRALLRQMTRSPTATVAAP